MKYTCNTCEYGSNFVAELWNHVLELHPGDKSGFDTKARHDILYNLVAEQNMIIMEYFNTLNRDIKVAVKQMTEDMDGALTLLV